MSEQKDQQERKTISLDGGVISGLTDQIKLIIRLMADGRVNPLLKLMPLGAMVYFFVPDIIIGPIDDLGIIWLGAYLFVELCPPDIVAEHRLAINPSARIGSDDLPNEKTGVIEKSDVIDAEFWEKPE